MKLDASKSAGALVGGAIAQILCSSLKYFAHVPIDPTTSSSVTILCIFLASHFIPNE